DDVFTRLDMGDCFWEEQGKLDEAEKWYADAVRIAPDHEWALPSLLVVRYLLTNDPRWRDELEDYADGHPANDRARVCVGRLTPFFADFIHPADASVNILKGLADQIEATGGGEISGTIKSTTSGLDVPSCRRSIDRQMELWGGKIQIQREILGIQSPDPREPRVPVRHRLRTHDDRTPQKNVGNAKTYRSVCRAAPYINSRRIARKYFDPRQTRQI